MCVLDARDRSSLRNLFGGTRESAFEVGARPRKISGIFKKIWKSYYKSVRCRLKILFFLTRVTKSKTAPSSVFDFENFECFEK